jgi:hypothetical protein
MVSDEAELITKTMKEVDSLILQERNLEAISLLDSVIGRFEASNETLDLIPLTDTLGRLAFAEGDMKRAKQGFSRTLVIRSRELGPMHFSNAKTHRDLASCMSGQEAEQSTAVARMIENAQALGPEVLRQFSLSKNELDRLAKERE